MTTFVCKHCLVEIAPYRFPKIDEPGVPVLAEPERASTLWCTFPGEGKSPMISDRWCVVDPPAIPERHSPIR